MIEIKYLADKRRKQTRNIIYYIFSFHFSSVASQRDQLFSTFLYSKPCISWLVPQFEDRLEYRSSPHLIPFSFQFYSLFLPSTGRRCDRTTSTVIRQAEIRFGLPTGHGFDITPNFSEYKPHQFALLEFGGGSLF